MKEPYVSNRWEPSWLLFVCGIVGTALLFIFGCFLIDMSRSPGNAIPLIFSEIVFLYGIYTVAVVCGYELYKRGKD